MEASIEIVYHAKSVRVAFSDDGEAKAAYVKVKTALEAYREYKNDRAEVVEVDAIDGAITLALSRMDAVMLNTPTLESADKRWREALENEKRLRDMREELGLPPTTNG